MLYGLHYGTHPFDVVGWDGCCYPYIFSIHDFEPITGRVHQPPPVHQTFETNAFVVCSFVPSLYDYHPNAIPAPYNHSNIDSDEVIYYVDGDFMSRKNVTRGMITLASCRYTAWPTSWCSGKKYWCKRNKRTGGDGGYFSSVDADKAGIGN